MMTGQAGFCERYEGYQRAMASGRRDTSACANVDENSAIFHPAGSANLVEHMRAAAILGLGTSSKQLQPFQDDPSVEWQMGMPAAADEVDAVLVFGGDGTIHRHLGQLVELGLPVLIVAAGSGNDFARSLGLPQVRDALAAWRKFRAGGGNVKVIDLGVITPLDARSVATGSAGDGDVTAHDVLASPRYFCCVAGVGLDAEVARKAGKLPRWLRSRGGYVLSLIPTMLRLTALAMKISSRDDGDSWMPRSDRPTLLAAFANTPSYGGGMKIAPEAKMDDGLLDVCVVGSVDAFKLFCMFPTVYGGQHLKIREVEYFKTRQVRVETEHPVDVYADGEYVCRTPVEIGIQTDALKIVTP
jgi:diacylglycerol kinase (ATP)